MPGFIVTYHRDGLLRAKFVAPRAVTGEPANQPCTFLLPHGVVKAFRRKDWQLHPVMHGWVKDLVSVDGRPLGTVTAIPV